MIVTSMEGSHMLFSHWLKGAAGGEKAKCIVLVGERNSILCFFVFCPEFSIKLHKYVNLSAVNVENG